MTCERYLLQAKSNENAARDIETVYPDWTVTMCFYYKQISLKRVFFEEARKSKILL